MSLKDHFVFLSHFFPPGRTGTFWTLHHCTDCFLMTISASLTGFWTSHLYEETFGDYRIMAAFHNMSSTANFRTLIFSCSDYYHLFSAFLHVEKHNLCFVLLQIATVQVKDQTSDQKLCKLTVMSSPELPLCIKRLEMWSCLCSYNTRIHHQIWFI